LGNEVQELEIEEINNKTNSTRIRKLTDEECLNLMKEKFPEEKGLTKTFISRKLKKRIMIYRLLDFKNEESYKNVVKYIPKMFESNNYLKVTMEVSKNENFSINSSLVEFMKDLFNYYFIILKESTEKCKLLIAGHIKTDLIRFLSEICNEEFSINYSVQTTKIKCYAFYEELIYEFSKRNNISLRNIDEEEINSYIKKYDHLINMRKAYEEIKQNH